MIWVVEKFIVYHFLDMGFEMLKLPIRVEVEYELGGSTIISLSKKNLIQPSLPYEAISQIKPGQVKGCH